MSQIKKYQEGGGLYINGKRYSYKDVRDYIDSGAGGFTDEDLKAGEGFLRSLENGNQRDIIDNSIYGEGITDDFSQYYGANPNSQESSERAARRIRRNNPNRSETWKRMQATFGTKSHNVNSFTSKLKGISDWKESIGTGEADPSNILKLLRDGGGRSFTYGTDQNGNRVLTAGPGNAENKAIINNIMSALQMDENTLKKTYDVSGWREGLNGLSPWYKQTDRSAYVNGLYERLNTGNLTTEDKEVLKAMNFNIDNTTPKEEDHTKDPSYIHKDWIGSQDAAKAAGIGINKDENGFYITGDSQFGKGTWYTGGMDWTKGTIFEDSFMHNGRLYDKDYILNRASPEIRAAVAPFIENGSKAKNFNDWYDAANASGVRFVGDRIYDHHAGDKTYYGAFGTQYNPITHYNQHWSNKLAIDKGWKNGRNISDLTNYYTNTDGRQIMAYINPDKKNEFGVYNVGYKVLDKNGNITDYSTEDAMIAAQGLLRPKGLYNTTQAVTFQNNPWRYLDDTKKSGPQYALHANLLTGGDQNNIVLVDKNGKKHLARKSGDTWVSPKKIVNEELLQKIIADPGKFTNNDLEKLYKIIPPNEWKDATKQNLAIKDGGNYAGMASKKIGGKIIKRQYGGAVLNATTLSDEQDFKDKNVDITKDHYLDGSDGGLTSAERWQIGAAIGDLAGVGLTFVPGVGNFAAVGTGLASTGARLIGDIKQDGFQMRDLGNAAIGGLMDFASVIPGLGTAAKMGKATRVIKSVASPLLKVFTAAGIVNGAQAVSKVINGEKLTSQDLQDILSGLGSTAIGGKMIQKGWRNANLAKTINNKQANAKNIEINAPKTVKVGEYEVQATPQELRSLLDEAGDSADEAIKLIKNKANVVEGKEMGDDVAKDILNKLGVDIKAGKKLSWKPNSWFANRNSTTNFSEPNEATTHGTLYYMMNPFARAKILGSDTVPSALTIRKMVGRNNPFSRWYNKAIGKYSNGQLNMLDERDIYQLQHRMKKGMLRPGDKALLDRIATRPDLFDPNIFKSKYINNGFVTPYIGMMPWGNGQKRAEYMLGNFNKYDYKHQQLEIQKELKRQEAIRQQNISHMNAYNAPFMPTFIPYRPNPAELKFVFKHGGVLKFQLGGKPKLFTPSSTSYEVKIPTLQDYLKKQSNTSNSLLNQNEYKNIQNKALGINQIPSLIDKSKYSFYSNELKPWETDLDSPLFKTNFETSFLKTSNKPIESIDLQEDNTGTTIAKPFDLRPDKENLYTLAHYFKQSKDAKKMRDISKSVNMPLATSEAEVSNRYSNYGLDRGLNAARKQAYNSNPLIHSDLKLATADSLARAEMASGIEERGYSAETELLDKFNQQLNQSAQYYNKTRANLENTNRDRAYSNDMKNAQADASYLLNRAQQNDEMFHKLQAKEFYNRELARRYSLEKQDRLSQNKIADELTRIQRKLSNNYLQMSPEQQQKYGSLQNYMDIVMPNRNLIATRKYQNEVDKNHYNTELDRGGRYYVDKFTDQPIVSHLYKKGGSVKKENPNNVDNNTKRLLQTRKDVARALEKLQDSTLKIILKAMK